MWGRLVWKGLHSFTHKCHPTSLVPRPSPTPVFDRLQYTKMEPEHTHTLRFGILQAIKNWSGGRGYYPLQIISEWTSKYEKKKQSALQLFLTWKFPDLRYFMYLLFLPMQLSIQGQWWSNSSTQRLHCRQCLARTGLTALQVWHML